MTNFFNITDMRGVLHTIRADAVIEIAQPPTGQNMIYLSNGREIQTLLSIDTIRALMDGLTQDAG
jgi:hypothetical protein